MASTLFETKVVTFGAAPFTNARIGYNAAAGCLNLLALGARCGLELVQGPLNEGVRAEGSTCYIDKAPHVSVAFHTDEQAEAFVKCVRQAKPWKVQVKAAAAKEVASSGEKTEEVPPETSEVLPQATEEPAGAAPSTPPARGAAWLARTEATPPRPKRARAEVAGEEEYVK